MSHDALWIVLGCWFASTIVGPLIMSSLDRLYSDKIDLTVSLFIRFAKSLLNNTFHIIVIVFLLPQLAFTFSISKVKSTAVQRFLKETKMNELPNELFRKDFSIIKFFKFFYGIISE